jgi:hypothetical protein
MNMKRPELDVALTDGQGYQVRVAPYKAHLNEAVEIKQVVAAYLAEIGLADIQSVSEIHLPQS